jgi:hypothetical protein
MNLNTLEKLARMVAKGENVKEESAEMVKAGLLTPAEHRSVTSLSFQIAANVRAGNSAGTMAYKPQPMGVWF